MITELHKGGNVWTVNEDAGKVYGVSVYEDLERLVFNNWQHLRVFASRYGYEIVNYPANRNT